MIYKSRPSNWSRLTILGCNSRLLALQNPKSTEIYLYCDGSVDPKTKIGYGAYLILREPPATPATQYRHLVKTKCFVETTSTKLELENLLWALEVTAAEVDLTTLSLTVFTDSANIIRLPSRKSDLVAGDFRAKSGRELNLAKLYREFYSVTDDLSIVMVKVAGHSPIKNANAHQKTFRLVDQACRARLKEGL